MMYKKTEDKRPDPKPRKYPQLWQSYLWWDEIMQMRKRHLLRISSIEAGKSEMDLQFEVDMLDEMQLDTMKKHTEKLMASFGREVPVWEWMTNIHGVGNHTAAKILALVDDIAKFDNISKLWRFCGYAVIEGGAERNKAGEKSHFNRRLKSELFLLAESFIKSQSPEYVWIYYEEKQRLRTLYPEPIEDKSSAWGKRFTDQHVHRMAIRKMVKIFLSHLWLVWREAEGLPVSEPYAIAHMPTHTHYIEPYAIEHSLAR
jgi:hypothetical protein